MAVSLNLTVGILGELSLGHAGFMCVGAFTGAVFLQMHGERDHCSDRYVFFLALLVGAVSAGFIGVLNRHAGTYGLRGDYLAIVTLAFGEIIKNLVNVLYLGKRLPMDCIFP